VPRARSSPLHDRQVIGLADLVGGDYLCG
jgi:hypothetical protein